MSKKIDKKLVWDLLNSGMSKKAVYEQLQGSMSSWRLADYICAWADPRLVKQNRLHVQVVAWNTLISLVMTLPLLLLFRGEPFWTDQRLILLAGFFILISVLFFWGFWRVRLGAWRAYFLGTLLSLLCSLDSQMRLPGEYVALDQVNALLSTLFLVYLLYVQSKLFPDIFWIVPARVNGRYSFLDDWSDTAYVVSGGQQNG